MVIVNRSAPFLVMVSQISGISRVHPMASDFSICPLHSLLRLQEKNNRPDAVRTYKHTNPIIFKPSAGGLYHLSFGYPLHSYSHFEPAPKSSCLARLPESRQQLIQPPVQSEGLLFDIVRNVDLPQIDGHISGV